jgi:DNA-binding transcriptional ArsR family regulator
MGEKEILLAASVLKNEKRSFILKKIFESKEMTWSQIVDKVEKQFNIRVNPNTISFHLRSLINMGLISKTGDLYTIRDKNTVKDILNQVK